ncbi:ubiquitin-like protein ATG12 [Octopus bimaculoides]|uniref:Ubiquitin-like protein ATG12 n=1 Tax=Octopus bimaculoides TaxID=37653 RepID=A0A0L8HBK5_OCTBM|nr:ubiquitin-like protein ATG12 [Octopus bimaculoides]|eukprot:XP_014773696.1 PREDICTED: ubiquitin-like protein ATG12 [Octopus bimaculoides]
MSESETVENLETTTSPVVHAVADTGTTPQSPSHQAKVKVDVLLKPAGDAPIMKKKRWAVERSMKVGSICEFIKKYIKCDPADSMFLYVRQSFAPSLDTPVGILFDCYGSDGKLVLHYCKTAAWG